MKPGPVTKIDKRNKRTSKKCDDEVMSLPLVIVKLFVATFQIYDRFGGIRKTDSGRIVCRTYVFSKSNLLSETRLKPELKHL